MQRIQFHDLPAAGLLRIAGADAVPFLQAQVTADLASLAPGDSTLAAWCSPQGRVIALLWVMRSADGLVVVLPGSLAGPVADRLRRFVMRAKATIEDASAETTVAGLSGTEPGSLAGMTAPDGMVLLHLPASRALLLGPTAAMREAGRKWPLAPAGEWEALAIAQGEPQVYPESSEAWIPQMLNLDLLGAVSFRKGCYPGQEIVARTQNLGRIKRRLFRYRVTGPALPAPGEALHCGQDKAGEVVRSVARDSGGQLLAVVSLEYAGLGLTAADGATLCSPEPLPYVIPEAADAG